MSSHSVRRLSSDASLTYSAPIGLANNAAKRALKWNTVVSRLAYIKGSDLHHGPGNVKPLCYVKS